MAPYQTHPHCSSKGPKVNMAPYYQKPLIFSDITPILGGKVLSGMKKTWEDIALSETRRKGRQPRNVHDMSQQGFA